MAKKLAGRPKRAPKSKLTDAERHKRFVDTAKEVEADERTEVFDKAFSMVTASGRAVKTSR
jgi:hypothetical protein